MSQTGCQMSREDMLRELELLPVWQLREPLPALLKVETPSADNSEQVVTKPVIQELVVQVQNIPHAEIQVIDIAVTDSAKPEPSIPESSTPAPGLSALPVLEVPALQQLVPQQVEMVESFEIESAPEPFSEQTLPLQLRLLLSEDSTYAFLIESYAAEDDVQQIEILLKNMIRAMQASCRMDVTDTADKIFAVHTPKLIISLGAAPANQLSGKTHTIDEWRNIQQQDQPLYEQIPLIVTYHPAHLLANTADKALAWRDLCAAIKLVQNL